MSGKKKSFSDINKKYSFLDEGVEGLKDRNVSRAEDKRQANIKAEEEQERKEPAHKKESVQKTRKPRPSANRERNQDFDSNLGYTIKMDAESIEKERRRIARKARMEREKLNKRKRFIFFSVSALVVILLAVGIKTALSSGKDTNKETTKPTEVAETKPEESKEHDSLKGFATTKNAVKYYKENNTTKELGEIPAGTYLEKYGVTGDFTKVKYLSEFGFVKTEELTDASKENTLKVIDGILVVNDEFGLPKDYEPNLNVDANQAFNNMKYRASNENIKINKASDFVTYDMLSQSFSDGVSSYGEYKKDGSQIEAGHSEHQTGLAIDVVDENYENKYNSNFAQTEAYKWLEENAYKNGFIIRYPEGKEDITGRKFEPWHLRFVGTEVASVMKEKDITLEEYLKLAKTSSDETKEDTEKDTEKDSNDVNSTKESNNSSEPTKETGNTEKTNKTTETKKKAQN